MGITPQDFRAMEMRTANARRHRTPEHVGCAEVLMDCVDFQYRKSSTEEKLNKLESAWLLNLKLRGLSPGIQRLTLRLAEDLRYTPDFDAVQAGRWCVWECKGFMRDDARAKLLTAAAMFPWLDFYLVMRTGAGWTEQLMKP